MSVQGNMNAIKTGCYVRLPLGRAHPKLEPARKRVSNFRRLLEQALVEAGGRLGPREACSIHAACTHAMIIELWTRRLRVEYDRMSSQAVGRGYVAPVAGSGPA